jgi:cholesterol transport system auxiliary component
MSRQRAHCACIRAGAVTALALLAACSALKPFTNPSPQPTAYSLNYSPAPAEAAASRATPTSLTLIVSTPHAAAGFDSPRMMYLRRPDQLEYFSHNQWVDTPARMLEPLIVSAVLAQQTFRAVVPTPSQASGDVRLDTEIVRLQQDFTTVPSQVRITLRAYLIEAVSRRVVASREFDAHAAAPSDDPRGGVTAAQAAVGKVLTQLATFCAQAASQMAPAAAR